MIAHEVEQQHIEEAATPGREAKMPRNRSFDLLRIFFATLVLFSHASLIPNDRPSDELLNRLTRHGNYDGMTLGTVGVDGFFLLSGFLIVQSWQLNPELLNFLRKRLLRIVPGYATAAMLSTVVIGLLAPGIPHFFRHLGAHFAVSVLTLSSPLTPAVFPGAAFHQVNGSLWTITYEFRCYLLVAILGICGLLRNRAVWLTLTFLSISAGLIPGLAPHIPWPKYHVIFGEPSDILRLVPIFLVGGCFYLFGNRIAFRPALALAAAAALFATRLLYPPAIETAAFLCGGYLMFYLCRLPIPTPRFYLPDISYGIYLYGWPVEALWVWYGHTSPWLTFLVAIVLSFSLGWLSWHFIERPMLQLKRRSTASLPAA